MVLIVDTFLAATKQLYESQQQLEVTKPAAPNTIPHILITMLMSSLGMVAIAVFAPPIKPTPGVMVLTIPQLVVNLSRS